jgi:hypothetical protein
MKGEFIIMIDGELKFFDDSDKIPEKFQHVIKFLPNVPPPPHNKEQHIEIESHAKKLQELLEIERKQNGS